MAQLVAKHSQERKALYRIINIFREDDNLSCSELRIFDIAMDGVGMPTRQRRREIEASIQRKRDRIELRRAAEAEAGDAP